MFRIEKCHDNEILRMLIEELSVIPKWLSRYLFESGLQLALYDNEIKINGLSYSPNTCSTGLRGREISKTHCFHQSKSDQINIINIVDYESDLPYIDYFSVIRHEIAHAIDWFLGKNDWWSSENISMMGIPLDDYAEIDESEQFAQAFDGYFQSDTKKEEPYWKYWHTQEEVFEKAPRLFEYFGQLLKEKQ